jgi:hypothetical protein
MGREEKEDRGRTDLAIPGTTRHNESDAPLDAARNSSSITGKTSQTLVVFRAAGAA